MNAHDQRDVLVIGAGAAGLAAARCLQSAGLDVCVLEASTRVAHSWWLRYEGLRLNTVRWLSDLPLNRMSARFGRWPDRKDWAAYLQGYSQQLNEVVCGVRAQRVERAGQSWRVHTDGGVLNASRVVVATGHDRVPVIPNWPGREQFSGLLLHSGDVRDVREFTEVRTLVVGTGNSGVELATMLADYESNQVDISMRTAPLMLKRQLGPIPITMLAEVGRLLPDRAIDWLGHTLHRRLWSDLAVYGMGRTTKRLSMMRHTYYSPPLDNGFAAALKRGAVGVVPSVTGFDRENVILDRPRAYDVVIAATGFRPGLEDLVGHLGVLDGNGEPKVTAGAQLPEAPGLYFAGFSFGLFALLPYLEGDARAITKAISGETATEWSLRRPLKIGPLAP